MAGQHWRAAPLALFFSPRRVFSCSASERAPACEWQRARERERPSVRDTPLSPGECIGSRCGLCPAAARRRRRRRWPSAALLSPQPSRRSFACERELKKRRRIVCARERACVRRPGGNRIIAVRRPRGEAPRSTTMSELNVDLGKLPEDVREKLAELDLELNEGE